MAADRMAAERLALGSLATDPLVRLQMAGINPEVRNQVRGHARLLLYNNVTIARCLPTLTPTFTCTRTLPPLRCCWASLLGFLVSCSLKIKSKSEEKI